MVHERHKRPRPPLDQEALERLGLFYAGRYATTRSKLGAYLARKVRERGWDAAAPPDIERVTARFVELGYVDDRLYAEGRAASLGRRGYGARRVQQALQAAGIAAEDAEPALEQGKADAWTSALRFAERKRLGPYATSEPDREARQKAFAAFMRAGHPARIASKILAAPPGLVPEPDEL